MCNITLKYISGTGCYLIEDLGISVSSEEENLVSNLFSVQDLVESSNLTSAILNGDVEARINNQVVQNLCDSSGGSTIGVKSFSQTFSLKGLVSVKEINFNPDFYLIAKSCQLDTVAGFGIGIWLLDVFVSNDLGTSWTPSLQDLLINGFTNFKNIGLNITEGAILKVRFKKISDSIGNPKVTILFNI